MNFRHSYAIFLRQFYLFTGNPSRWTMIFFWSTADLLIWGLLTKYLNGVGGAAFNFITVLIGSVVFMHFIGRVQGGVGVAQLEDVWTNNLVNFFVTPLRISEYALGLVLTAVFVSAMALGAMVGMAWLLFHYSIFQFGIFLIPFVGVLFLFGVALGFIGIGIVIRFGPSAETFTWIIPTAFAPFSGVFYPVSTLPMPLQWFAHLVPSSYIFEGMRTVVLEGVFSGEKLLIAFFLSVVYLAIGYGILHYYFRQAIKRGLLIRFLTDAW